MYNEKNIICKPFVVIYVNLFITQKNNSDLNRSHLCKPYTFTQKKITEKVVISVNVWLVFLSTVCGEKIARCNLYTYTPIRNLGGRAFSDLAFSLGL